MALMSVIFSNEGVVISSNFAVIFNNFGYFQQRRK